jgi:SNF2 family DNA or RNA helicase
MARSPDGRLVTSYLYQNLHHISPRDEADGVARATLQNAMYGGSRSSKLDAIFKELESIWKQKPKSKVIVFSQFIGMLDLLAHRFLSSSIPYERLDGKLSLAE